MSLEYIRFFGFDFVLVGNNYHFYPSVPNFVKNFSLSIKPATAHSNRIDVKRCYIETKDSVKFKFSSPFAIRFEEQYVPHLSRYAGTPIDALSNRSVLFELGKSSTNTQAVGLDLNIGPLRLVDENCFVNVHEGSDGLRDLWIKTHRAYSLLKDDTLPISMHANQNTYFRMFKRNEDDDFRLQFTHNPFTLTTKFGIRPTLLKLWQVHNSDMGIYDLLNGVTWTFLEDKKDAMPLYLHPFSKTDENGEQHTLAAIGLDCKSIKVHLKRNNNENDPLFIDSLIAVPKPQKYLHTYGLVANTEQGYHRWVVSEPLVLAVRIADSSDKYHGLLLRSMKGLIPAKLLNYKAAILGIRREVKLTVGEDAFIGFDQDLPCQNCNDHISLQISLRITTPYIKTQFGGIALNRPGIALSADRSNVNSWDFTLPNGKQHSVLFPLCPDEAMLNKHPNVLEFLHAKCNTGYQVLESKNTSVTHETNLHILGGKTDSGLASKPTLKSLFYAPSESIPSAQSGNTEFKGSMTVPRLGAHINQYDFGNYVITKTWAEDEMPEYIALISDKNGNWVNSTTATLKKGFPMDPAYSGEQQNISISALTMDAGLSIKNSTNKIVGIVKLGKESSLTTILEGVNVALNELSNNTNGGLNKELPQKLTDQSWTGLILFEQVLDLNKFELLESLLPEHFALKLRFLAISPDRLSKFATYGLVAWENPNIGQPTSKPPSDSSKELRVIMAKVEITWVARKLTGFLTNTIIEYRSFCGARKPLQNGQANYTRVNILGSIDRETEEIRFLAQTSNPIPLLDENGDGVGPFKQVTIKQIEITRSNNKTDFNVDGDISLQAFSLGDDWNLDDGDKVGFDGLKFGFLNNLELDGNWLSIDYPSLRFDFAKGWKLLDFGGFNLELKRFAFDTQSSSFEWGNLLPVINGNWQLPSMRLGLQLNLGKLPFLSQNPFEDLMFDFELALPFSKTGGDIDFTSIDLTQIRLYLRALGFNKLNLKLMRFLEISADTVILKSEEAHPLWLFLKGLKLKILNKTLIEDFTLGHYWEGDQKGFIGLLDGGLPGSSLITIDWLLIGRNLRLNGNDDNDLIKAIVSIEPNEDALKDKIQIAFENNTLIPSAGEHVGEWVFAAGFKMFDEFLLGKFLFHDGAYYGLAIDGPFLKKWFGYDLAISVLYIVKDRPEQDIFRLSLRVPSVSLGGIAFNGGIVVIEIQMNGSFLLDVGYPWLADNGERQWERGFGIMLSGLMGKGGAFIAMRSNSRKKEIGGARPGKLTLLEGGQAAMVGIGGDFRAGPLRVTAFAGIYYTCEGSLLFFTPNSNTSRLDLVGLRLSGSIGIQARGIAELDWWIISIRIEVIAGAEARLTLFWGALEHHQPGSSDLPAVINGDNNRISVRVDFVLYARVSAKACIGSGWFKICKSISLGVSMPYQTTLYLS